MSDLQSTTASHVKSIFEPILVDLEGQICSVECGQIHLKKELEALLDSLGQLKSVCREDNLIAVLEEKSKKLISLKRKLTLVHTLLQNSNERCIKLLSNHPISN